MRNRFAKTFHEEAKRNPALTMIVADISPAGAMEEFRKEFPGRFINTGVAEQVMIGAAAGMAAKGLRPFCYTIATFALYRPFEFIRNDLAYQNLPVTVVGIGAGLNYSTLGATHHAFEDVAVAATIPGLGIIAPCDPYEVEAATQWLARHSTQPTYLRLGKAGEPQLSNEYQTWEWGKLRPIWRSSRLGRVGPRIAILTYGPIAKLALEVGEAVIDRASDVLVVSAHTLRPLDTKGIKDILVNFDHVVIIEEAPSELALGGWVQQLAHQVAVGRWAKIWPFGLQHKFSHTYGTHADLLAEHKLTKERILADLWAELK